MREELHRYLDGELPREKLPGDQRGEAEAWEALLGEVRRTAVAGAPAWLEGRVIRALADEPRSALYGEPRSAWRRAVDWLTRPRVIRVAPAPAFAAFALLLLMAALPWLRGSSPALVDDTVYVQLFLEAPAASSVAIAGDFNGWSPTINLEDRDGDGVWSGRLAVPPGIYEYMFVLDGSRWVTDPHAEWYSDDGFGNRNAVLAILSPASGT